MLPDFPRLKRRFRDATSKTIRQLVEQHPVIGQIQKKQIFEGDRTSVQEEQSPERDTAIEHVAVPVGVGTDDLIARGPQVILDQIPVIAGQFLATHVRMLVTSVDTAVGHTGNSVSAEGKPFTSDLYLTLLQSVEITFKKDGTPSIPTVFHPDPAVHAKLEARVEEWMKDAEFRTKVDAVLEKKRQEWRDRESDRTLVD